MVKSTSVVDDKQNPLALFPQSIEKLDRFGRIEDNNLCSLYGLIAEEHVCSLLPGESLAAFAEPSTAN